MIKKWITPLGIALIVCAPITSSAAVKIYSAPQGIEASGDFAVTVDGQKAFVFSLAENGLRKGFLPGAERMAPGEDENEKKTAAKSASESWVSFETAATALITIAQLAGAESLKNVLRAISVYNHKVGYCQSMNFVLGFIMLVNGGDEKEAFLLFEALS